MKSNLLGTVSACVITMVSLPAYSVGVSGQGTWETTLQGRDLYGNAATFEAYYDTTLNITWLADADYANTSGYPTDVNIGGLMTWGTANTWAASLNFNGITGWRLPAIMDTGPLGCDSAFAGTDCGSNVQTGSAATTVYSEMASMFYDTLGNKARSDTSGNPQPGWGLTNTGPFSNISVDCCWSETGYALDSNAAWHFSFGDGHQDPVITRSPEVPYDESYYNGWAVHDGDIGAVPIPPALYLFGTGLIGLIGMARKKAA